MLVVIETHPIQYHAPVYRDLQARCGIPVTAVYGSDFSLHGYHDREFGAELAWDVDLTSGFGHRFLASVHRGGSDDPMRVSARGIGAVLDELAPRAVLIVGYSPAFHRRAWAAAWRRRLPVLFRGETSDLPQTPGVGMAMIRGAALRLLYARCARVLYIGERAKRHYRAHGVDHERLVFSPYCVDTSAFRMSESDRIRLRAETRRGMGIGDDRVVLLFSGKLSLRKGIDLIDAAVRRLPDPLRSQLSIVCAGDGAERAAMEVAAAVPPAVPFHVLGVQSQAALSRWYHASDLLVLPSRHSETWGLVVNEALHHGLPCVISDHVGCAPDLIDERTGVVCAAGSARSLADAIAAALPIVRQPSTRTACRDRVARYSVAQAADGIAQAYCAVLSGRHAA